MEPQSSDGCSVPSRKSWRLLALPAPSWKGRSCANCANSANSSGALARGVCAAMGLAQALPASHIGQVVRRWLIATPWLCADRGACQWLDISGMLTRCVGGARRAGRAGATSSTESLPRAYGPGPRFSGYCVSGAARRRARAARARGWLCLLRSPPDTLTSIGSGEKSSGPGRRCAGHAGWRSRAGDRCRITCLSVCLSGLCVTCLRPGPLKEGVWRLLLTVAAGRLLSRGWLGGCEFSKPLRGPGLGRLRCHGD